VLFGTLAGILPRQDVLEKQRYPQSPSEASNRAFAVPEGLAVGSLSVGRAPTAEKSPRTHPGPHIAKTGIVLFGSEHLRCAATAPWQV
jgi:hypothetical protein